MQLYARDATRGVTTAWTSRHSILDLFILVSAVNQQIVSPGRKPTPSRASIRIKDQLCLAFWHHPAHERAELVYPFVAITSDRRAFCAIHPNTRAAS